MVDGWVVSLVVIDAVDVDGDVVVGDCVVDDSVVSLVVIDAVDVDGNVVVGDCVVDDSIEVDGIVVGGTVEEGGVVVVVGTVSAGVKGWVVVEVVEGVVVEDVTVVRVVGCEGVEGCVVKRGTVEGVTIGGVVGEGGIGGVDGCVVIRGTVEGVTIGGVVITVEVGSVGVEGCVVEGIVEVGVVRSDVSVVEVGTGGVEGCVMGGWVVDWIVVVSANVVGFWGSVVVSSSVCVCVISCIVVLVSVVVEVAVDVTVEVGGDEVVVGMGSVGHGGAHMAKSGSLQVLSDKASKCCPLVHEIFFQVLIKQKKKLPQSAGFGRYSAFSVHESRSETLHARSSMTGSIVGAGDEVVVGIAVVLHGAAQVRSISMVRHCPDTAS